MSAEPAVRSLWMPPGCFVVRQRVSMPLSRILSCLERPLLTTCSNARRSFLSQLRLFWGRYAAAEDLCALGFAIAVGTFPDTGHDLFGCTSAHGHVLLLVSDLKRYLGQSTAMSVLNRASLRPTVHQFCAIPIVSRRGVSSSTFCSRGRRWFPLNMTCASASASACTRKCTIR